MRRISSLSQTVAWDRVLGLLGVPPGDRILPAVTTCPLCRAIRLWIYPDSVLGGHWHHCTGCGTYGDMIELAAFHWKLGLPSTVARLAEIEAVRGNEQELEEYVALRQQLQDNTAWWRQTRAPYVRSDGEVLRRIGRSLGVVSALHRERTPESFAGATSVDGLAAYNGTRLRSHRRRRGWTDLLVVPHYDMPGRISAVSYFGDETRDPMLMTMKPFSTPLTYDNVREAGLAFLEAAFRSPPEGVPPALFVMADVAEAFRMHSRWLRTNSTLLPIVAVSLGLKKTVGPWRWLRAPEVVIWHYELNPEILRQARLADARISHYAQDRSSWDEAISHSTPPELLRTAHRQSQPWRTVLRQYLARCLPKDAEEVLAVVDMPDGEMRQFLYDSPTAVRERIEPLLSRLRTRIVHEGRNGVTIKNGGWYADRHLICDAPVTLRRILRVRGVTYYQGSILYNGVETEFTEKTDTIEAKGLFKWAYQYLIQRNVGVMTYLQKWNKRALEIAIQFHKPEIVDGISDVGWDAKRSQFNLPQFSLRAGGEILSEQNFIRADAPARDIPAPRQPIERTTVDALSRTHEEANLFWATFLVVMHNVIAPAVSRQPAGAVVTGDGAQAICRPAARLLGCLLRDARTELSYQDPPLWPEYFVTGPPESDEVDAWLEADYARNVFLAADPLLAAVLHARGGTHMIRCHRPLGVMQQVPPAAAGLVSAYLHDVCRRKIWLEWRESLAETLLYDVAEWFASIGGREAAVLAAAKVWRRPGETSPGRCLAEMVFHLLERGKLAMIRSDVDYAARRPVVVSMIEERPAVWVPQVVVSRLVQQESGLSPNLLSITDALRDEGALIEERIFRDERGWLLDEKWWSDGHNAWSTELHATGDLQ